SALLPKFLELLDPVIARGGCISLLRNPRNPNAPRELATVRSAAEPLGRDISPLEATGPSEILTAFHSTAAGKCRGLIVTADRMFNNGAVEIARLSLASGIAAITGERDFAVAGGMMSYGQDAAERDRQIGRYAGRILAGEKPADLPVLQPSKF